MHGGLEAMCSKVGECPIAWPSRSWMQLSDTLQLHLDSRAAIKEDRHRPRRATSLGFNADGKNGSFVSCDVGQRGVRCTRLAAEAHFRT